MSRERRYLKRKRHTQVLKQKIVLCMLAFSFILSGSFIFGGFMTSAHDDQENNIQTTAYYKSIEIQSGDTLWDIAKTYKPVDLTVDEYIDELMQINSLTSDSIHADQFLTVACYESESI